MFTWDVFFLFVFFLMQDRVGGRVATFRKGNYVADLGAMVVTGLGKSGSKVNTSPRQGGRRRSDGVSLPLFVRREPDGRH